VDSSLPETQRRSYTIRIESQMVQIHDLTIENTHQNTNQSGDQAMAVEVKYGSASFFDCNITGYQDTFLGRDDSARVYAKGCLVEGNVDFIYGASVMLFDHCQINVNREGAAITAPSTAVAAPYGITFLDCEVTSDEVGFNGAKVNNIYLGRAWHYGAKSVWVRCKMPKTLHADGWMANMSDDVVEEKKIFAEWGCTYAGADASARKHGGRVLTDQEAATYTAENIFADMENLEAFVTKYKVEF
jgi:pectinesterase